MRAVLLAAGQGTRLKPLTDHLPKPAVPFMNRPLACQSIDVLLAAGVTELVVNAHHLPDKLIASLTPYLLAANIRNAFSVENELLGTGGGVRRALHVAEQLWGPTPGDVLVMNADIWFRPQLGTALHQHREQRALATMVVVEHSDVALKGGVRVASDRVRALAGAENAAFQESDAAYLFSGVHILSPEFLPLLPEHGCIVRKAYVPAVQGDQWIGAYVSDASFWDLGTPHDYLEAHFVALQERGVPLLDESESWRNGAATLARSVIGEGVIVVPGIEILDSVVWADARVEQSLSRAIQGPDFCLQADQFTGTKKS